MREENAEDPGERGGELQKLTLGALGGGAERDRMGPALGSLASWGRGGGRTIPAAGFRRPRGRAESRSGRPALPFLLVADAEAACGEAAPGPHQPQPGRTEAAAAGEDPRPGQFFRYHRTPKHSVLLSQGFPLGWGHMLLWRPWPQGILTLRIPSQTPSRSQNAIFIATPRVCKFHTRLCKFHSRGQSVSTSGSVNSPSSSPTLPKIASGVVNFIPRVSCSNPLLTLCGLVSSPRVGQFRLRVGQDHSWSSPLRIR